MVVITLHLVTLFIHWAYDGTISTPLAFVLPSTLTISIWIFLHNILPPDLTNCAVNESSTGAQLLLSFLITAGLSHMEEVLISGYSPK